MHKGQEAQPSMIKKNINKQAVNQPLNMYNYKLKEQGKNLPDGEVHLKERKPQLICSSNQVPGNGAKNLIGLLGSTPKCRLSQVIKSRKSEVDPQGIDEEKLFEVKKIFVTKIKMVKGVHK